MQLKSAVAAVTAMVAVGAALTVGSIVLQEPAATETQALAACLVDKASTGRLHHLGEAFGSSGDFTWRRGDAIGCPTALKYAVSSSYRTAVEPSTAIPLLRSPYFRRGMYGGYGLKFGLPAQEREALGGLGMYLEQGVVPAATARYCGVIQQDASQYLETVLYPFSLAAVGNQAPSLTNEQVYEVAEMVMTSVRDISTASLTSDFDCLAQSNVASLPTLTTFLNDMADFRDGAHPLAPGCKADVVLEQVTLSCVGAGGKTLENTSVGGERKKPQ